MTSGVYILTNRLNGRRYIGYSENIEIRWEEFKNIKSISIKHPLLLADRQKSSLGANLVSLHAAWKFRLCRGGSRALRISDKLMRLP